MKTCLQLLIIYLSFSGMIMGQSAEFSSFEGLIYNIPKNELEKGHGPHVYDNEILGSIQLDNIDIDKQHDKVLFPGVSRKDKFGLVLHSELKVEQNACYSLMLASDDGSKLWLNDQLILNNDRPHKMRVQLDSFDLKAGIYKAKLWYYNAYPDQYGLVLKAKLVSTEISCKPLETIVDSITLSSDIVFDFEAFTLKEEAFNDLDIIIEKVRANHYKRIQIIGYTDNIGDADYNLKLSMKRAEEVFRYLNSKGDLSNIHVLRFGKGETEPLVDNLTDANRKKNRRVVILLVK